jgi:hypothetical protein
VACNRVEFEKEYIQDDEGYEEGEQMEEDQDEEA